MKSRKHHYSDKLLKWTSGIKIWKGIAKLKKICQFLVLYMWYVYKIILGAKFRRQPTWGDIFNDFLNVFQKWLNKCNSTQVSPQNHFEITKKKTGIHLLKSFTRSLFPGLSEMIGVIGASSSISDYVEWWSSNCHISSLHRYRYRKYHQLSKFPQEIHLVALMGWYNKELWSSKVSMYALKT